MRHSSIKLNTPCELINITPFNPLISKCQIKVCWVGDKPNRNKSIITKEVATTLANSLPGSPIVGYYNEANGDFEEHNRLIEISKGKLQLQDMTRPYGFVDLGAKVWFQKFLDDGVEEREYLMTEGWLWTGQYPECQRVVTKGNNHSMELDETILDAHWTKDVNGNRQFFIINEAIISKLCILGEDFEPCFEGGSIEAPVVEFAFDEGFKQQLFSMMKEITQILTEGGAPMTEETKVLETKEPEVIVEEPVVEEPTVEPVVEAPTVEEPAAEAPVVEFKEDEEKENVCPECGKPSDECECDKDKKNQYVLEEIPEYVEVCDKYSQLETQYNELENTLNALKTENEELIRFKKSIEKKEKEAMIKSFYMLSDDLKKEVSDNIDTYSLEDIEAKLSIICVRNKVNFSLEDEDTLSNAPTTYNLNDVDGGADDLTPAWIKALENTAKNNI